MSDFSLLPKEAKEACFRVLAEQALLQWGFQGAKCSLIRQGAGALFDVQGVGGKRAILRVHRADYHFYPELLAELQWVAAFMTFGVEAPRIIPSTQGFLSKRLKVPEIPEGRQVDMISWVDAKPLGSIERVFALEARRNYRVTGRLMGHMHNFSVQWQAPAEFIRQAWDEESILGEQPLWGRFWELEVLSESQRERVLAGREMARHVLKSYSKDSGAYSFIHADTLHENFLIDAEGTVHIVNFDGGGYGWHLFDIATAMFPILGEDNFGALFLAFMDGYQEVRSLPADFEDMLPLFFLLRGFTYLGWLHVHAGAALVQKLAPMAIARVMGLLDSL